MKALQQSLIWVKLSQFSNAVDIAGYMVARKPVVRCLTG